MKKGFKVALTLIVLSVMFCFAGCVPLNLNFNLNTFSNPTTENETIEFNTNNLSNEEIRTVIAEKYLEISFTVIVAENKQVKTFSAAGEELSSDETIEFQTSGSGTLVYKGGYILTNCHVVGLINQTSNTTSSTDSLGNRTVTTTKNEVYVSQDGGETNYLAEILWSSSNFDLAIIHCSQFADLNAAPMKDRFVYASEEDKLKVLESVITVGTQYSLANYGTVTIGTVSSALPRALTDGSNGAVYEYLIQHDAPINHGSSGGALVDLNGNLIGVNSYGIDDAHSLFYSVSIYPVIQIIDTVVENYEQFGQTTTEKTIGFSGYDRYTAAAFAGAIEEEYQDFNESGLIVSSVENNCIVEGLKVNDIVVGVEFDDAKFEIDNRFDLLYARIQLFKFLSGKVTVLRDGERLQLDLKVKV